MMGITFFILGTIFGSFLNVLIQRLPREESIVGPRSECPRCRHSIAWYDNVPLASFVFLKARCRHCQEKISWRYPWVELASGCLWAGIWYLEPQVQVFTIGVIFLSLLLVGSVTDLETQLIPNFITLGGLAAGLLASLLYPALHGKETVLEGLLESGLGILVGGGAVYLIGLLGNVLFKSELARRGLEDSMGGGDVKLMAMAGSFLGWENVLLAFFTAPFLGLPFALYGRFVKKEAVIPYGPFLSLAAAVQFLWGEKFNSYLRF